MNGNFSGAVCARCRPHWELDGLLVIAPYAQKSLLQTCIKTMKYGAAHSLVKILGDWMAEQASLPAQNFILIPVPLFKTRERKRGYNQALLLAERVARATGQPLEQSIKRIRNTPPQAQLSRENRLKNLRDAFCFKGKSPIANKKVILIDDVCSTGATLNECAKVLRQQGVKQIWGLVLARG